MIGFDQIRASSIIGIFTSFWIDNSDFGLMLRAQALKPSSKKYFVVGVLIIFVIMRLATDIVIGTTPSVFRMLSRNLAVKHLRLTLVSAKASTRLSRGSLSGPGELSPRKCQDPLPSSLRVKPSHDDLWERLTRMWPTVPLGVEMSGTYLPRVQTVSILLKMQRRV